jgi:hypothetical protein
MVSNDDRRRGGGGEYVQGPRGQDGFAHTAQLAPLYSHQRILPRN